MPEVLSYVDAVRLLGGGESRFVGVLDRLTGGALLAAAVPVPALLGIFDAKAEFVRLGHDLVRELAERRSGLSRYGRTQRLEAAHAVLAVTAFFEVFDESDTPLHLTELAVDKREELSLAGARPADPRSVTEAFFGTAAPLPGPGLPYPRLRAALRDYYSGLARRLLLFVTGLAAWERVGERHQERFEAILDALPDAAVDRHGDLLTALAADFPEVGFWAGLHEHEATRIEVRTLTAGLDGLRRTLADLSTGRAPDERRAALARSYAAALGRPIAESGDVPADLRMPSLGAAYLQPLCRVAALEPGSRPSDELWWHEREVRADLPGFLVGYLTSPGAVRAPLLVLGQPGSGKSVLTRILAAQLPAADFLTVRVVLRDVPAAADPQDQIEQAIRADTGERLDWPALARSAGDALPVVLLDGFDELLQATGVSQTDYLLKIATFQRREADQGRPVAVLVTSRTSVADRAQPPPGTVAVRLEPFDDERVATWVRTWNDTNAGPFAALGVRPLEVATVLAHRELAEQPLLLLMLALYDAEGNRLRAAGELRRGELYERLLRSFAQREVVKHRPGLPDRELDRAIDEELYRLAIVAFAMFNRRAQWVTETELEADLVAVFGPVSAAGQPGLRTPLRPAEVVLGRFFFIHRSQASRGEGRLAAYEFLHATFGEFLVARLTWLAVADVRARESAATMSLGGTPVDDDFLRALLSFAALSGRAPVVAFLAERMSTLTEPEQVGWTELLVRLFQVAQHGTPGRRYDDYLPRPLPIPARYALYTANLLLLAVCAAGRLRGRELFPAAQDVVDQWHDHALFWRSQLAAEEWASLVNTLALTRIWDGNRRDVSLELEDGSGFPIPRLDPNWTYNLPPGEPSGIGLTATFRWPNQDPERLRRRAHFECGRSADVVQHALEPLFDRLGSSVNSFLTTEDNRLLSTAHLLLDLWLSERAGYQAEDRERAYRRCVAAVEAMAWTGTEREEYVVLLLNRLAIDTSVPARLVADVVEGLRSATTFYGPTAAPTLRCCLAFLGRDREADARLEAMIRDAIVVLLPEEGVPDDLVVEAMVRLQQAGDQERPQDGRGDRRVRTAVRPAAAGSGRPDAIPDQGRS